MEKIEITRHEYITSWLTPSVGRITNGQEMIDRVIKLKSIDGLLKEIHNYSHIYLFILKNKRRRIEVKRLTEDTYSYERVTKSSDK